MRADVVVLATEAYTAGLPGRRRDVLPLYSLMVGIRAARRAAQWDEIGLAGRPTFHDARHSIIYGQRTADGRLAFGGRGAPYHFGSRDRSGVRHRRAGAGDARRRRCASCSPCSPTSTFPYHWGGPLGVPRDWRCSGALRRGRPGIAVAGGYVGDGVATTNLAGRTLADLITGRDTELVRAAVGRPPAAAVGARAAALARASTSAGVAAGAADAAEDGTGRAARWRAAAWSRLLGLFTGG